MIPWGKSEVCPIREILRNKWDKSLGTIWQVTNQSQFPLIQEQIIPVALIGKQ
jgi:hypothetical protein